MKWKTILLVTALLSSFFVWGEYTDPDPKEKESMIMDAVIKYLNALHFKPVQLDDEFSSKTFDRYIKYIDPGKRFLIQSEIDALNIYRSEIDNQVKLKNFDFFNASIDIIENSRNRAQDIFARIMSEDLETMATKDVLEMDNEKRTHPANEGELEMMWKSMIKYDFNKRLRSELDKLEDNKDEDDAEETEEEEEEEEEEEPKTLEEIKADIKEKIQESYEDWFKRMSQDKRSDRFEVFINSITHNFDPHSDFFNPHEKQDFDIRMGGKLEGIGARLQTEDDYTKVTEIIPGGPAWKGKELEVDDLIMAVTQKGKEPVDISGMRIDDVVSKIRGKKGTVVILTVKKVDGSTQDVEIERDEVIIDEGFARSLKVGILDEIENIGYIKLPKFYSSFERKGGNSCAKDVAAEIEKLKDMNVNGIVLDLRNNGGGSLQDVVEMTGLFLEDGGIVQVKPRDEAPQIYEDDDESVLYDGPLIVMVNQFSASASEILAAALQDYNRAVIVGSKSTFGKGTVQRFVDLDRAYRGNNDVGPLGQLKITMQKFFRVDGGSTQLKGVEPDIVFPNNYHYITTGEKDYDEAMDWSEIEPIEFGQDVYKLPDLASLKFESEDRMAKRAEFNLILENAQRLKQNRDESIYPLDYTAYDNMMDSRKEKSKKFENLYDEDIDYLKLENLSIDTSYINSDDSRVARNEDWLEGLQKDFYLEETLYIMKDLIAKSDIAALKD